MTTRSALFAGTASTAAWTDLKSPAPSAETVSTVAACAGRATAVRKQISVSAARIMTRLVYTLTATEQGDAGDRDHRACGRFGDRGYVGYGCGAGRERRALELDAVVDRAVVRRIDEAVVVEVAIPVSAGAFDLDK